MPTLVIGAASGWIFFIDIRCATSIVAHALFFLQILGLCIDQPQQDLEVSRAN
jgi:hypothetical protein